MTWQQIGHDYVALEMTDVIKHCLGMPYNGKFCPWPNLNYSKNNGARTDDFSSAMSNLMMNWKKLWGMCAKK